MVSRRRRKKNKSKGKARIAAKAKEELVAFKPFSLKQFKKSSCTHGWNHYGYHDSHDCHKFIETAVAAFRMSGIQLHAALAATCEKYPEIWKNPAQLEWIASAFVSIGVEATLGRKYALCVFSTSFSEYLKQHVACTLHKSVPTFYLARIDELLHADLRRIVSYMRKRVLCSCLDVHYESVKHLPKMGLCCNRQSENDSCSLPDGKVKLGEMWSCERCRRAHYCSEDCQAADWIYHKGACKVWRVWQSNQIGTKQKH